MISRAFAARPGRSRHSGGRLRHEYVVLHALPRERRRKHFTLSGLLLPIAILAIAASLAVGCTAGQEASDERAPVESAQEAPVASSDMIPGDATPEVGREASGDATAVILIVKGGDAPVEGIGGAQIGAPSDQNAESATGPPSPPDPSGPDQAPTFPTPDPPALAPCSAYGNGTFLGCYFTDVNLSELSFTRDDPVIDFDWLDGPPIESLESDRLSCVDGLPDESPPPDRFSVRWQGEFHFSEGTYEFVVAADDRVRLLVDDIDLINEWYDRPLTVRRATARLNEETHGVSLEYADGSGLASVKLQRAQEQDPYFTYSWEASAELTGQTSVTFPEAAPRPVIVLNGEPTLTLNTTAAMRLAESLDIVLLDDEDPWEQQSTGLLYEMVRRLPDTRQRVFDAHPWSISLTTDDLVDDVTVTPWTQEVPLNRAVFSRAAFARSTPRFSRASTATPTASSTPIGCSGRRSSRSSATTTCSVRSWKSATEWPLASPNPPMNSRSSAWTRCSTWHPF